MEVKGEDFLKNIEIEKQKNILKEQADLLNKNKEQAVFLSSNNDYNNSTENSNELNDIVLEDKKSKKQKYIVLSFALILLFLLTIIIIRLFSDPISNNSLFNDKTLINDSKIDVIKTVQNDEITKTNDDLDINKIQKDEEKIQIINDMQAEIEEEIKVKEDLFNIKTNTNKNDLQNIKDEFISTHEKINTSNKPKVSAIKNKEEKKVLIAKKVFPKSKTKIKGFYVQVGAFTKEPNKNLIKNLIKNNFQYVLYKVTIKNTLFTKVLVGSYKSRNKILPHLEKIRKISNNPKAYILEFK